jgi:hypothetical protein
VVPTICTTVASWLFRITCAGVDGAQLMKMKAKVEALPMIFSTVGRISLSARRRAGESQRLGPGVGFD